MQEVRGPAPPDAQPVDRDRARRRHGVDDHQPGRRTARREMVGRLDLEGAAHLPRAVLRGDMGRARERPGAWLTSPNHVAARPSQVVAPIERHVDDDHRHENGQEQLPLRASTSERTRIARPQECQEADRRQHDRGPPENTSRIRKRPRPHLGGAKFRKFGLGVAVRLAWGANTRPARSSRSEADSSRVSL